MGFKADMTLKCDGWCGGDGKITHFDEKGYIYCTPCGNRRKGSHRCRKLTGGELATIKAGEGIRY